MLDAMNANRLPITVTALFEYMIGNVVLEKTITMSPVDYNYFELQCKVGEKVKFENGERVFNKFKLLKLTTSNDQIIFDRTEEK